MAYPQPNLALLQSLRPAADGLMASASPKIAMQLFDASILRCAIITNPELAPYILPSLRSFVGSASVRAVPPIADHVDHTILIAERAQMVRDGTDQK